MVQIHNELRISVEKERTMNIKGYVKRICCIGAGIMCPIVIWIFCPSWSLITKIVVALIAIPNSVFFIGFAIFYVTKEWKKWQAENQQGKNIKDQEG